MRVTAENLADELDTAGLADLHGRTLAERLAGYRENNLEPVTAFSGQPALRREVAFGDDDAPYLGVAVYLVHGGMSYIASSVGPAEQFTAVISDVEAVTDRLTLLGTPLVTNGDGAGSSGPPTGLTRPSLTAGDWSGVRRQWQSASKVSEATDHDTDLVLSAEELLVVAGTLGAGVFPTVAPHALANLKGSERAAVGRGLVRSLVTHGVLDTDGDQVVIAEPVRPLLEVGVFPDLMVEVSRTAEGRSDTVAFCVRPDTMVVVEADGRFGRRLRRADAGDLVGEVVRFAGLDPEAATGEGVPTLAVDDVAVSVRCRATWRDGTVLVGGDLLWVADAEGRWWSADPPSEAQPRTLAVHAAGTEALRTELLDHLPGS